MTLTTFQRINFRITLRERFKESKGPTLPREIDGNLNISKYEIANYKNNDTIC